jgi:hypothetical protein
MKHKPDLFRVVLILGFGALLIWLVFAAAPIAWMIP